MKTTTRKYVFDAIRRICGGDIEIVDAKEPLRLQPQPCDLVGADPRDPGNCLLVHTAARMYDARLIIFWKTIAYVELVGRDGKRRIEKFHCSTETIRQIEAFDRGAPLARGAAIILLPISKSNCQKERIRKQRDWRQTQKAKNSGHRSHLRRRVRRYEDEVQLAKQSLATAERDGNRCGVKDAKVAVVAVESRLDDAQKKLSAFLKKNPGTKGPHRVFDLTTRNGAIGNYKFIERVTSERSVPREIS